MTTVDIDNAHVFPEDEGTDAPADYEQQWSAGLFAGKHRHDKLHDYVAVGLQLYPDQGDSSLDISSGLAHILADVDVEVQASSGNFSETWRSGIVLSVDVPDVDNLSLTSGATNHVFLAVDMAQGDGAYYEVNSTGESPSDPFVKIGEYNHDADSVELLNRGADIASAAELADLTDSFQDHVSEFESHVSEFESHAADESAHHERYSDDEAVGAVDGATLNNETTFSGGLSLPNASGVYNALDIGGKDDTFLSVVNDRMAVYSDEEHGWGFRTGEGQGGYSWAFRVEHDGVGYLGADRILTDENNLESRLSELESTVDALESEVETRAAVDVLAEGEALPDWADAAIRYEQ